VTIHRHVAEARQRLRAAGIAATESDLDARLLAQHVLGWTTERFLTDAQSREPADFATRYDSLVARRAARVPLAYIVGTREFWGLDFEVTSAVLIPRPATELIVEALLDRFPDRHGELSVADICTGSGCVAVAIAHERPAARVIATDLSLDALTVATRNATRHGVAARIDFRQGDLVDPIEGEFDAIVANPPYVVDAARPALQPEVRDYEPAMALFGGADGLGIVSRLVAAAPAHLKPDGWLMFEFGYGQEPEIELLVGGSGALELVDIRRDIDGIGRTAITRPRKVATG
jgi:release factor glutamine methyltransferase